MAVIILNCICWLIYGITIWLIWFKLLECTQNKPLFTSDSNMPSGPIVGWYRALCHPKSPRSKNVQTIQGQTDKFHRQPINAILSLVKLIRIFWHSWAISPWVLGYLTEKDMLFVLTVLIFLWIINDSLP